MSRLPLHPAGNVIPLGTNPIVPSHLISSRAPHFPKFQPTTTTMSLPDLSKLTAYPTPSSFEPTDPLNPRPLRPLQPPPPHLTSNPPSLPSPPRPNPFKSNPEWTCTTHIFPAAFPRSTPDIPVSPPTYTPDKKEWKRRVEACASELFELRDKQWRGELEREGWRPSEKLLWGVVNRYVRRDTTRERESKRGQWDVGVSMFFAHANGFPKEIWEPTLEEIVNSPSAKHVTEIWVWEAVNHGDAGLINAPNLSGIYDWQDNARDILTFLLYHLPISPFVPSDSLPTLLPRLPDTVVDARRRYGYGGRKLFAVGHSYGGCSVAIASTHTPTLFTNIVFVDPIIRLPRPGRPVPPPVVATLVQGALSRRGRWRDREEAKTLFLQSNFFKVWHPSVLEKYVQHGLVEVPLSSSSSPNPNTDANDTVPAKEVQLKMPSFQEAVVFTECNTSYEAWMLVPRIDERIELKFVMPGVVPAFEIKEKQQLVHLRPRNSSNVIIHGAGHLVPHEAPKDVAREIVDVLERKYVQRELVSKL
ncbi:hypothetical protein K474DRAFT_1664829 [Panus rudis PR-1116 ss-1]|nr:hypothetical protein K474DRAFT_1664829 [Panus rudis PR-1116 ss-1]